MFTVAISSASAATLSTTNSSALRNFWLAADQTQRPVTVLSFGDSMADSYRSISYCLMNQFVGRLGVAGYSLRNYANTLLWNLTNGTQHIDGPSPFWFSDHFELPPGGGMWWEAQAWPGGLVCDRLGVFYVAWPGGGRFTLSVSTNSGPWTQLLTVDGFSPSTVGRFTNLDMSLDHYRLRVDSLSGTNVVVGAQVLNRHTNGVHVAFTDYPGIALSDVTNVPLAIRAPIFAALAPDLLIWHMKEDGSEATHQRLLENEQWWSNSIPNCSVLYIGTPYASVDLTSTATVDQNTLVRSVAVAFHRAYVDCMDPAVSFDWMYLQGYMADGTHENVLGNQYLEHFAWNDLGFFALGTPLRLSCAMVQSQLNVSFQTVSGIRYTLESSSDFSTWQTNLTVSGGAQITYVSTDPVPRKNFRLRLQPGN
jgi:hypothetical protein